MPQEVQLVIMGPTGRIDMTNVSGFHSRQLSELVRVNRIDGHTLQAELPRGWDGEFDFDVFDARIYELTDASEMYQYIQEADGSVTVYQFSGVGFVQDGKHIKFTAERRRRI